MSQVLHFICLQSCNFRKVIDFFPRYQKPTDKSIDSAQEYMMGEEAGMARIGVGRVIYR